VNSDLPPPAHPKENFWGLKNVLEYNLWDYWNEDVMGWMPFMLPNHQQKALTLNSGFDISLLHPSSDS